MHLSVSSSYSLISFPLFFFFFFLQVFISFTLFTCIQKEKHDSLSGSNRCLNGSRFRSALLIHRCHMYDETFLVVFCSGNNRTLSPAALPIEEMAQTLEDLITYFQPPEEDLEHEDKQSKLRSLKNRQNLFKEEVQSEEL